MVHGMVRVQKALDYYRPVARGGGGGGGGGGRQGYYTEQL